MIADKNNIEKIIMTNIITNTKIEKILKTLLMLIFKIDMSRVCKAMFRVLVLAKVIMNSRLFNYI